MFPAGYWTNRIASRGGGGPFPVTPSKAWAVVAGAHCSSTAEGDRSRLRFRRKGSRVLRPHLDGRVSADAWTATVMTPPGPAGDILPCLCSRAFPPRSSRSLLSMASLRPSTTDGAPSSGGSARDARPHTSSTRRSICSPIHVESGGMPRTRAELLAQRKRADLKHMSSALASTKVQRYARMKAKHEEMTAPAFKHMVDAQSDADRAGEQVRRWHTHRSHSHPLVQASPPALLRTVFPEPIAK